MANKDNEEPSNAEANAKNGQRFDERFEQIDRRFEQIDQRFEQVDTRFDNIEETLAFIVKKLDFYIDRTERHIDVLNEQNESNLQAQGEGIKVNRKRLENHEVRIGRLESAG